MTKAIRSYPKKERQSVVNRRLLSKTKGLGYWAARGYAEYIAKESKKEKVNK